MSICGVLSKISKAVSKAPKEHKAEKESSILPIANVGLIPTKSLSALQKEYLELWNTCRIRDSRKKDLMNITTKILESLPRYRAVQNKTGVPWPVIACIHQKEASLNFNKNLMNGQPLNQVTTWVPKGKGPWETWEESAIEALEYDGLTGKPLNKIYEMLEALERYNGWGYRRYRGGTLDQGGTLSPYLWAATNHYSRGGYVKDGKYSSTFVQTNPGCAAVLKTLEARNIIRIES